MKKLILFLVTMLIAACSAPMPGEDVSEVQLAACTGAPVATGTIGSMMATDYVASIVPWVGPPAEAYSAKATMQNPAVNAKLSWGSTSGAIYRTTGCTGPNGACGAWSGSAVGTLQLLSWFNGSSDMGVEILANGSKVAEIFGVNANTSLQTPTSFSGGLQVIRQHTGANSRFYFEGWNAGVWTSRAAKFYNTCGSIN